MGQFWVGTTSKSGSVFSRHQQASDGYANSYRDEASFQQVARDVWVMLQDEGDAAVKPARMAE